MKIVLRVLACLLAVGGMFAIQVEHPKRAEASSAGCTNSSGGTGPTWNCIEVNGISNTVDYVRAARVESGGSICYLKAQMVATKNGGYVEPPITRYAAGECSNSAGWVDFDRNKTYPDGTKICVNLWKKNSPGGSYIYLSGSPCQTIQEEAVPEPGPPPGIPCVNGPCIIDDPSAPPAPSD